MVSLFISQNRLIIVTLAELFIHRELNGRETQPYVGNSFSVPRVHICFG
jgi:hypothetical protein